MFIFFFFLESRSISIFSLKGGFKVPSIILVRSEESNVICKPCEISEVTSSPAI